MFNREKMTAPDGEETKEAFCPSSLLLLLHALCLSVSPILPFSCPFIPSLTHSLDTFPLVHYSLPLSSACHFSSFHLRLPPAVSSSLSLLSGLSEHSVEIRSVTVSLETDTVGLPGVSTQ